MRVLLLSVNTERINMTVLPLGTACVAEAVRGAGHSVKLLNLTDREDAEKATAEVIGSFDPHVIGLSVRNIDDQSMENPRFLLDPAKKIVDCCRRCSHVPLVLGGAGFSIFPMETLDYLWADLGIQGEGEASFPLLLRRLGEGDAELADVPGLHVRGKGLRASPVLGRDLSSFPLPQPDFLTTHPIRDGEERWLPFQTRRGCPMACSYCSTATVEGRLLRKRPPQAVVDVLARYTEAGFDRFYFVDNTFNLPPAYAEALCDAVIAAGLKIRWRCIYYPLPVKGRLVEKMAAAGCREVSLGCESGSGRVLRSMNKRFGPEDVRAASAQLRANGIRQMGFLLLGGPGETKESVLESFEFVDSLDLDSVKVTVGIRIYPGTSLARTAVEEGLLSTGKNLLFPTFYVRPELACWLKETAGAWLKKRPHWIT